MKKLISLLLVMMLVLSCAAAALAVQNVTNEVVMENGTITVAGAIQPYNYALYKLLHLHSYNHSTGAYTYKIEDKWATFFAGPGATYVTVDTNGYVSWAAGADVVEFGKDALEFAETNGITPESDTTDSAHFEWFTPGPGAKFKNLSLGYYLVDTSMGSLCGLSTAKPDGHIVAKNGAPTVDKKVQEDSHVGTGTAEFGKENTADIGQYLYFDVTIDAKAGAQNYVYHDKMSVGMIFNPTGTGNEKFEVKFHRGSVTTTLTEGVDYILKYNKNADNTVQTDADGNAVPLSDCALCKSGSSIYDAHWKCDFEVQFTETFLETLQANDKLYIRYSAILNDKAGTDAAGNKNTAQLTYGESHKTTESTTTTYTYGFDIYKADADQNRLNGAEFKLYDSDDNLIHIVYNKVTKEYRRATKLANADEEECGDTITVVDGLARIKGLDNGTYYLKETKAPDGYTLLTTPASFTISSANLYKEVHDGVVSAGAAVYVENNKGVTLPETGGLGTLLFTVLGGGTALGTGVVLVTKKRMSKIEDDEE